jgi:hypothetical protein
MLLRQERFCVALPPASSVDVVPLLLELLDLGNCWIMLSNGDRRSVKGRPWDDSVALAQELISKAPRRMIWGSDWPHPMVPINEELKDDGELLDLAGRSLWKTRRGYSGFLINLSILSRDGTPARRHRIPP